MILRLFHRLKIAPKQDLKINRQSTRIVLSNPAFQELIKHKNSLFLCNLTVRFKLSFFIVFTSAGPPRKIGKKIMNLKLTVILQKSNWLALREAHC